MSSDTLHQLNGQSNGGLSNGFTNGHAANSTTTTQSKTKSQVEQLDEQLKQAQYQPSFHGDHLLGDKIDPGVGGLDDLRRVFDVKNWGEIAGLLGSVLKGEGVNLKSGGAAQLVGSLANDSINRAKLIESQVKAKYDRMLHPPLTYLGDAFKYRTADGKFNSALNPHLGQAGAPYAKTVPSKTHPLGALPDAGDLFDRLLARDEKGPRESQSGLSMMLIYHATIIIHDIFRTNDKDKNISDTSSYLDLSPLYGFTDEMQRKVRDDKYKLGLLKPDTFAEDRLLRQPPGVCIMLVMYNRYHNYAATQLRRINENGKFSVPKQYDSAQLSSAARKFALPATKAKCEGGFENLLRQYDEAWKDWKASCEDTWPEHERLKALIDPMIAEGLRPVARRMIQKEREVELRQLVKNEVSKRLDKDDRDKEIERLFQEKKGSIVVTEQDIDKRCPVVLDVFNKQWQAAWDKLDHDLFNTARLITCGMYIQVSIHDYLRALMGFHNYDTNFTLDPRLVMKDHPECTRGVGNQVTVEFNLLYRFHCAISGKDEAYAETFIREAFGKVGDASFDPKSLTLEDFMGLMSYSAEMDKPEPEDVEFGLKSEKKYMFKRDPVTKLFNDQQMIDALKESMDDPISNFGPRNIPRCLKPIEVLGILQARKWEIGTLNDFRDFFGMPRHKTFESITPHKEVQAALRDLYEHPDKVELYPGVFCETNEANGQLNCDPGPSDLDSALWAAIFSDAITLVRSDRFYTTDWNTNSLTTWGMKEVTADNDILKSSVFHRLLQRAFPEWYPSDSVRFFHPFYTGLKNSNLAYAQNYQSRFDIVKLDPLESTWFGKPTKYNFDFKGSNPKRPKKPLLLEKPSDIRAFLDHASDDIVHPARLSLQDLPEKLQEVLKPGQKMSKAVKNSEVVDCNTPEMLNYFLGLSRDIVKREFITMNDKVPTYQIDIVKDFAIPVVTRYVADFLGVSSSIRSPTNTSAKYSENEIYQHITNCQVFLSYNADETKLLKRRQDFKSSMKFLYELTQEGHVREANKLGIFQAFDGLFKSKNPMEKTGFKIAHDVLKNERDFGRSAAILMLIGLDSAYNAVLAFTSVLDHFMKELYTAAEKESLEAKKAAAAKDEGRAYQRQSGKKPDWLQIQEWAFDDDEIQAFGDASTAFAKIKTLVLEAQRRSVKLPIIRKATEKVTIRKADGTSFEIDKGRTIICDLNPEKRRPIGSNELPNSTILPEDVPTTTFRDIDIKDENDYLAYASSFTDNFAPYHPKSMAALSLTAMIKVLAQMKNLRRGHDGQGYAKKVKIESSYEGYSNYMAPMRMRQIEFDVKRRKEEAKKKGDTETVERLDQIFNTKVLRPLTYTYLTPEWDEMVPFPTTWKVRFDGFGESTYGGDDLHYLWKRALPDYMPPWYQPTGPSQIGGSFATWDDAYAAMKSKGSCPVAHGATSGCALPMKP